MNIAFLLLKKCTHFIVQIDYKIKEDSEFSLLI